MREGAVAYANGIGPSLAKHSTSASFDVATFDGVRGVGTKRALAAGDVFMVLPCEIAMTTTDAFFDPVSGPAVRKLAETHPQEYHSQAMTMLFLMTEALQYDSSRFAPYLGMLPPMGPGIMPIMDIYRAARAIKADLAGDDNAAADADDVQRREAVLAAYNAVVGTSPSVKQHVENMDVFFNHVWGAVQRFLVPKLLNNRTATDAEEAFFHDLTTWAFDVVKTRSWASHGCDPANPEEAHGGNRRWQKGLRRARR